MTSCATDDWLASARALGRDTHVVIAMSGGVDSSVAALREGPPEPAVLAGPTCDSIDVIAENLMLPELRAGDIVVGRAMGAYTLATSTEFNFFPRATVVAVNRHPGDAGGAC